MKDDISATFSVSLWLDSSGTTPVHTGTYAPGEHTVTLPTMSVSSTDVRLSIHATDAQGRQSDRLFQRFRVIDPLTHPITVGQTYSPSAATLLTDFGIYNNDTNPVSTTAGLNTMLQMSGSLGIRKVVLPTGTYRISELNTVKIPTQMTLDLNGSTLKLNPSAKGDHVMVEIAKAYDSHVLNGTIEGDLDNHDYSLDPDSSHLRGVRLAQGAEYCSFRDLLVKKVTGYGTTTSVDFVGRVAPFNLSHDPQVRAGAFTFGEFDEATGLRVSATDRTATTTAVDISAFMSTYGFIQLGIFGGYQSNPSDNWTYRASFYDSANNYIGSTIGSLYRRMYPPAGAAKAQFTLFAPNEQALGVLWIFNMRYPYNCDFINIAHQDVRCVGMVPSGFNNLSVTGCTWENCGWASARSAFDSEDGWDCAQDLVFKNNTFGTNPGAEFNGISGHNFIIENNVMGVITGSRLGSPVVRNNTFKSALFNFGPFSRLAYPRIYNNTVQGLTTLNTNYSTIAEMNREYHIRDNTLAGGLVVTGGTKEMQLKMYAWKCDITGGQVNARAVNCDLSNVATLGTAVTKWFQLEGCDIQNCGLKGSSASQSLIISSTLANCTLQTSAADMTLINNTITDSTGDTSNWSANQNWHVEGNTITTSGASFLLVRNSFSRIGFYNNVVNSTHTSFKGVNIQAPSSQSSQLGTPFSQYVTPTGNTFNGNGGAALNIGNTGTNITLTVGIANDTYNSITPKTTSGGAVVTYVTPPTVSLTAPSHNSTATAPAAITISANASDPDGTISKVEFYHNNTKLGESTSSPYSLPLTNVPEGAYRFTARALDSQGMINVSTRANVNVNP